MLNLTENMATQDQIKAGVVEPVQKSIVRELLTFNEQPTLQGITNRALDLAELAKSSGETSAMIGGAPFLMSALETALKSQGIKPYYAYCGFVEV